MTQARRTKEETVAQLLDEAIRLTSATASVKNPAEVYRSKTRKLKSLLENHSKVPVKDPETILSPSLRHTVVMMLQDDAMVSSMFKYKHAMAATPFSSEYFRDFNREQQNGFFESAIRMAMHTKRTHQEEVQVTDFLLDIQSKFFSHCPDAAGAKQVKTFLSTVAAVANNITHDAQCAELAETQYFTLLSCLYDENISDDEMHSLLYQFAQQAARPDMDSETFETLEAGMDMIWAHAIPKKGARKKDEFLQNFFLDPAKAEGNCQAYINAYENKYLTPGGPA